MSSKAKRRFSCMRAKVFGGAVGLPVGEEEVDDRADDDEAEHEGDHQFDQGEAALAQGEEGRFFWSDS